MFVEVARKYPDTRVFAVDRAWNNTWSETAEKLGRRPKILVGKPGLDGHSNGAEQIALRARDSGMDVVYEGIRLTPAQIAASALHADCDTLWSEDMQHGMSLDGRLRILNPFRATS